MFDFKVGTISFLMNWTWEDSGEAQWCLSDVDINQAEWSGHSLLLYFKKANSTSILVLARGADVLCNSQLWEPYGCGVERPGLKAAFYLLLVRTLSQLSNWGHSLAPSWGADNGTSPERTVPAPSSAYINTWRVNARTKKLNLWFPSNLALWFSKDRVVR